MGHDSDWTSESNDDDWHDDTDGDDTDGDDTAGDDTAGDGAEDPATVPCPFCRREILEDTPRCPHCGRYLSDEDHARSRTPRWVLVTAVLCLVAAVWMALAAI